MVKFEFERESVEVHILGVAFNGGRGYTWN
jgi:hypothetical protein